MGGPFSTPCPWLRVSARRLQRHHPVIISNGSVQIIKAMLGDSPAINCQRASGRQRNGAVKILDCLLEPTRLAEDHPAQDQRLRARRIKVEHLCILVCGGGIIPACKPFRCFGHECGGFPAAPDAECTKRPPKAEENQPRTHPLYNGQQISGGRCGIDHLGRRARPFLAVRLNSTGGPSHR